MPFSLAREMENTGHRRTWKVPKREQPSDDGDPCEEEERAARSDGCAKEGEAISGKSRVGRSKDVPWAR
jgi:hypothetical protein